MKFITCFTVACIICVLLFSQAQGTIINYVFSLDGLQEVPPNASPAIGSAIVTLDTVTNLLTWNITFSYLLAPETGAHFHKAPVGVSGPVVVPLALGTPKIGSTNVTSLQASDIMAGLWYVNIHTSVFPGGEIRGQVVPEPATLLLLGVGGLLLRSSGRSAPPQPDRKK